MKMTLKSVVQNECACYFREGPFGVSNFCVNGDKTCVMFAPTFKRCGYFQKALLLAWPDVAAEYAALVGQEATGEITVTRQAICRVCGEAYRATGNRQQYCSEACKVAGKRGKDKNWQRTRRAPTSVPSKQTTLVS